MEQKSEIKVMVKDGSYFRDALEWYTSKYIFPFTLRASILVLSAILLIGLLISVDAAKTSFVSMKLPFPIYAKDQVNYFSIIKPLAYKNDSLDMAISRYFIRKYVELRESYNFVDFSEGNEELTFNKVKALSSHQVYDGYKSYIDPDANSDSPIIKYKNQIERVITIKDVKINSPHGAPEGATVAFTATEKGRLGVKSKDYEVELSFLMSDMTKVFEKIDNLYFIVTKYRTYELSK
jgi:type IV secretory pathway component VirB8